MRGLARIQKQKETKSRRKKLAEEADVSGADFKINILDDRFSSLLDGTNARFGIDPTDPNFRNTPAMKEILTEQSRRRRRRQKNTVAGSKDDEPSPKQQKRSENVSGVLSRSPELNTLISSITRKVEKVK